MVVDKHSLSSRLLKRGLHGGHTTGCIKIETEHEIGVGKKAVGRVGVLVITYNFFGSGQPLQKVGIGIGHHHRWILAQGAQILGPS